MCSDIDECSPNPCGENCTQNPPGHGYSCSCAAGKKLDVDQRTCIGKCRMKNVVLANMSDVNMYTPQNAINNKMGFVLFQI